MTRRITRAVIVCAICHSIIGQSLNESVRQSAWAATVRPLVNTIRLPNGGIQPQLVLGQDGAVHMLYYKGDAGAGDIFYVVSQDHGESFTDPIRINSQPGSAIAAGTIRGAHLALGKNDRVHVAWNGSATAKPRGLPNPQLPQDSPYRYSAPMLYARLNDDGTGFEPQRNLMTSTHSLDGGGSIGADDAGNVYVVWHANAATGAAGEAGRAVWVAVSQDDGQSFAAEFRANRKPTGACGCCGLRAATDQKGNLYVLYRSAMHTIHRDMYLLVSNDKSQSFATTKLDEWTVGRCVMSSAALYPTTHGMLAAWETEQQVKFGRLDPSQPAARRIVAPTPGQPTRKHPVLCTNSKGQVILVWTEGTGWQKGGSVAWQVFDAAGQAVAGGHGQAAGVPVWGLVAVFAGKNDQFTIVY